MASSPLSSLLPSLSPLRPHPHSPPLTPLRSVFIASPSRSSTLVVSAVPKKAYTSEEKQRILESYGLDPADFAQDPPSHKTERRRGRGRGSEGDKAGRGKRWETVPEETKKIPRTTHKLLQVLGGKSRRTKLLSPKGMDVRPMMEVVRGAAFDILQVAGGSPASLRPGRWLDLYSGTGSVGIEALSRGCSEVHFVEMDPWVVSEVLRPNLECTGFLDVSTIHTTRVESFLEKAEKSLGKGKSFDYVSITPPYTAVDYTILLEQIGNSALVGEDCFILVEYPLETSVMDSCGHLTKIADRRFGRTKLIIYGPEWAQKKRKSDLDHTDVNEAMRRVGEKSGDRRERRVEQGGKNDDHHPHPCKL